jgi:hypothetical protein
MAAPQRAGEGRTDIAALSAAVTAVVVSMFLVTGPFEILGAMVAVTLSLVMFGYVWRHSRTVLQSPANRRGSCAPGTAATIATLPLPYNSSLTRSPRSRQRGNL